MRKSYLMRRPEEDEEDYYVGGNDLVHAKPIEERYARSLGDAYKGKDFVRGSQSSQQHFYGQQTVVSESSSSQAAAYPSNSEIMRPLTHDERNKISAKIIKAEMKQNTDLVRKLREKLHCGMVEINSLSSSTTSSQPDDYVLLMKMDKKSGLVMPAEKASSSTSENTSRSTKRGAATIEQEYSQQMDLKEIVSKERSITSLDQMSMFGRADKVTVGHDEGDDWSINDGIISNPKQRRTEEKDRQKHESAKIRDHKQLERTLVSCHLCIDSKVLEKHAIVATGLKTYLAVVPWNGLGEEHCYIAPMEHYVSSLLLDENVYDEMKLWFKGLVAMWRGNEEKEQDCIFIENGKYANIQRHMTIECIPIPKETGDLAPIYFKKAIMDSEKEWSDNKKLIELSKPQYSGDIRKALPKGFPFFAVNFGLQSGYAHVIENENMFPDTFAQEIVAGMMNLPHRHWRKVKPQSFSEIKEKRDKFRAKWQKYDWTKIVKDALK